MAISVPRIIYAKKTIQPSSNVPKGYISVYVGDDKKRLVIPVTCLKHPSFQDLLNQAAEEFGFDHPMGGLTLPCQEDIFVDLTSRLNRI